MKKVYSNEERAEALKLASEVGVTAAGRQLGINPNAISNWKNRKPKSQQYDNLNDGELHKENHRLKKDLADKAVEVEILQAALGFFAKGRKK